MLIKTCSSKKIVVYKGGDWAKSFKTLPPVTQCARKRTCAKHTLVRLTLLEIAPSYMKAPTPLLILPPELLRRSLLLLPYPFTHSFNSYYSLTLTLTLVMRLCPSRLSLLSCVLCCVLCYAVCCVMLVVYKGGSWHSSFKARLIRRSLLSRLKLL